MRFREAKEAGLDHLPALYVGAKHLNLRKLHLTNCRDLRGKLDSDIQTTLEGLMCTCLGLYLFKSF